MTRQAFRPGDPVPWFIARSNDDARYTLQAAAGRYVVLCFFGSAGRAEGAQALRALQEHRQLFDDKRATFLGVTIDRQDEQQGRLRSSLSGIRFIWDFDLAVSRQFGAVPPPGPDGTARIVFRPFWLVLDPMLRVLADLPLGQSAEVMQLVATLPPVEAHAGVETAAPVLIVPRVFEPDFCRHLIGLYEAHGGEESGFMRVVGADTVVVVDHAIKRRADHTITDEATREAVRTRILARLAPEIRKAFHFRATRMERYIVACYDGADGGHFRAHRDNMGPATRHRRFAVSLNLNAEEFTGGDLRFPEFGARTYRPPTGGAVVFSCSLLHEAMPVTSGRRYVFLPFLYDEEGAAVREASGSGYRKGAALG
jgi:peroxiredoxin